MKCSAMHFGKPCSASSQMGIGWLHVSTPDGKKYALCELHKLGGEVTVHDSATDERAAHLEALRRLAERESRLYDARRAAEAEADK